ncbi:unnamed protein product [Coregonus sp. 'balchen']|nr:unnamed protein product [Coregonus sp. 'balchen']
MRTDERKINYLDLWLIKEKVHYIQSYTQSPQTAIPYYVEITLLTPIPNGNYKCGSCAQCNSTTKTSFFRHTHTGQKVPVRGIISYKIKGVIYLITCTCGKAYVGQTKRQ